LTTAGARRPGVAEMTRFGMGPTDFAEPAGLTAAVLKEGAEVKSEVNRFGGRFAEMQHRFGEKDFPESLALLRRLP
jgi:glycine/serine hydroxymethyltransferase